MMWLVLAVVVSAVALLVHILRGVSRMIDYWGAP
jgi:hypothetical protein